MAPLEPFGGDRRVAVAVSGGADSMALALLLARWGRPLALIVDHGLRPDSAAEAAQAAARLGERGIAARVLPPLRLARGPALAARARDARYAALSRACREAGLSDLLVAHHAQDQAETLLLRRNAGSGPAGLAGMAAVTHGDTVRLLRPLLPVLPARLRATLRAAGMEWAEDPTNNDLATPRARIRADLRERDGTAVETLCRDAQGFGLDRRAAEADAAEELARRVTLLPCGVAVIAGGTLGAAALSALIWTVSGARYPPAPAAVARLAGELRPSTLGGAAVVRTTSGWMVGREAAAQAPDVPAKQGLVWDGRFRLLSRVPDGCTIGPLGAEASRLRRWSGLPSALLRTLPAIRCNCALFAVPHLFYPDQDACRIALIAFCPSRPASPTPFAVL